MIDPQSTQGTNMFFMQSEISLKDNVWDIFDQYETEEPMFETSKSINYNQVIPAGTPIAKREYISIFFRADSEQRFYKREGYDMLTFLGDLGGLFDIIMIIGWGLTSIFAGNLLTAALIGEVYKIQNYFRDSSEFYETKNLDKLTTESVSLSSVSS